MVQTGNSTFADDDTEVIERVDVVESGALATINKSEIEAQIDAAHKYPRSLTTFKREALDMATLSQEVAESCIFSLPRGGKPIAGPSIRLAEICASAWGNIHAGARPVAVDDKEVTSQGVCWDVQRNVRIVIESKRRITDKNGKRYKDDMITMTQNAASSIALRNAIFRVIPRAYIDQIYAHVRKVAVGDASTLAGRRSVVLDKLAKMGASLDRVLHALKKKGADDIGLDELEILIGYGTAIKEGEKSVDELFPDPKASAASSGADLSEDLKKKAEAARSGNGNAKPTETPKGGDAGDRDQSAPTGDAPTIEELVAQLAKKNNWAEKKAGDKILFYAGQLFKASPEALTPEQRKEFATNIASGGIK